MRLCWFGWLLVAWIAVTTILLVVNVVQTHQMQQTDALRIKQMDWMFDEIKTVRDLVDPPPDSSRATFGEGTITLTFFYTDEREYPKISECSTAIITEVDE